MGVYSFFLKKAQKAYKTFEPRVLRAYKDVRKKAISYGIPMGALEDRVMESISHTRERILQVRKVYPFSAGKFAGTSAKRKRKTVRRPRKSATTGKASRRPSKA